MLNLSNEQRDPSTFVGSIQELHERLSFYIGAVISVELDSERNRRNEAGVRDLADGHLYDHRGHLLIKRTVTAGRLERVKLTEGEPGNFTLGYCFDGDSAIREDIELPSSRIRVLEHGSWATIHEPGAWWKEDQDKSKIEERKRLEITPKSQWTMDERSRHG